MSIRVVVIDDSAMVRRVLTQVLERDPDIEVVGAAPDPFAGRDLIVQHEPQVVLLDMEMPRMDGLTFLRRLMRYYPIPVIVVSSLTTAGGELALEALRCGAVEVVSKPHAAYSLGEMADELPAKVKIAARATPRVIATESHPDQLVAPMASMSGTAKIAAIGASTGGTSAIERLLMGLAAGAPGMVMVQHIPEEFGRSFAKRLDKVTDFDVKTAEDGDGVTPGRVLLAPGKHHMAVRRSGALFAVRLTKEPEGLLHRPSVNVLFDSVAREVGRNAIGVLLTGMGEDGADGLLAMRQAGAATVAQDERSSVVYGMPKAAAERDAAGAILALDRIPSVIMEFVGAKPVDTSGRVRPEAS